jgi:hypothetical protein
MPLFAGFQPDEVCTPRHLFIEMISTVAIRTMAPMKDPDE